MYKLLGICLALASFFAVNVLASFAISLGWRSLESVTRSWSARARAELLFALRIGGPLVSVMLVSVLFVPAYIGYEPHATSEVVSKKLAGLAMLSGVGVAFAGWRSLRSWSATAKLKRSWATLAREIKLPNINIPTFQIPHSFPIIAVVGTFRPRLFIADQVLRSLNQDELAAAIAHECGHLTAGDNLKRVLLRACRDLLMIMPCGRSIDRAWSESVECAADEYAAQTGREVALNLASALVRIARMVPVGARAEMPVAAFLVGDETRGIKARVRRLLEIASTNRFHRPQRFHITGLPLFTVIVVVILGATLAGNPHLLLTVHSIVERVVFLLS